MKDGCGDVAGEAVVGPELGWWVRGVQREGNIEHAEGRVGFLEASEEWARKRRAGVRSER